MQARQLGGHVIGVREKQLAGRIQQAALAPAGDRHLLGDPDLQRARATCGAPRRWRPRAAPPDRACVAAEIDVEEAGVRIGLHQRLELDRGDALEAAVDDDGLDGPVEQPRGREPDAARQRGDAGDRGRCRRQFTRRQPDRRAVRAPAISPTPHRCPPVPTGGKLVSRIRQTSSSKSMPAAAAAIGTRLWLVMPGTVLISSTFGAAVGAHHEIHAPPAARADGVEGGRGNGGEAPLGVGGQAAGAEVAGLVAEVLGLVVVEHGLRLDADQRQRPVVEDRGRVLGALDPLLGEHLAAEAGRRGDTRAAGLPRAAPWSCRCSSPRRPA